METLTLIADFYLYPLTLGYLFQQLQL